MENHITIFNNPEFGEIRTLTQEDQSVWFVGKDVASVLGYAIPQKAILEHVDEEDRIVLTYKAFSKTEKADLWSGNDYSNKILINESGLYALILSSKRPKAREFKHWVTSEVLPAIRQIGGYMTVKAEDTPESIMARAVLIAKATIDRLQDENKELSIKANHLDKVVMCNQCYTTTIIAKELGMTAVELNKYLCEQKIQFLQSGQYNLYADFARMGLAKNRTAEKVDENGNLKVFHPYLVWTERGRVFIHNLVRMHPPRLTNKLAIMFVQPTLFT